MLNESELVANISTHICSSVKYVKFNQPKNDKFLTLIKLVALGWAGTVDIFLLLQIIIIHILSMPKNYYEYYFY